MKCTNFSYNKTSLLLDGHPWFPVMGEFHYSRYPKDKWADSLAKMKAGGVSIVSTYVFWLHHEPEMGHFNFEGQNDLLSFLKECDKAGLYVFLRPGPWCHAEARNGGFPDWLMQTGWSLRSNDPRYINAVRVFWKAVAAQTKGMVAKDGGPVIGTQIENEYGHCGGADGDAHMNILYALAQEVGFITPYYTATGWGGANVGKMLPVMGGYCDAPWDASPEKLPASGNFVLTTERNDHNIGSDFHIGHGITFAPENFPFLTAELGGGLQVTYNRRPMAHAKDIGAMSLCKMGGGANLLGYYMYHGGTNPGYGLQESKASGSFCDLPELNYDFRAPIREYGQIAPSWREIHLFSMFAADFGETFCSTETHLPENNPLDPNDFTHLRWCWRNDGSSGYVFVNNHVRGYETKEHIQTLKIPLPDETVCFESLKVPAHTYAFYPFNMKLGSALLKKATATPLCILNGSTYVFYADCEPMYELEGKADIFTITRKEALMAQKITRNGREELVISQPPLVGDTFITRAPFVARFLPEDESVAYTVPKGQAKVTVTKENENYLMTEYSLMVNADKANDTFLRIAYVGNMAELYLNGKKIADDFYRGDVWEVGLSRFDFPKKLTLRIFALEENAPVLFDDGVKPIMKNGRAMALTSVTAENEYLVKL